MKILWLCNIILPVISEELKEPVWPFGGWMEGLLGIVGKREEAAVCFPYKKGDPVLKGNAQGIVFYGYRETDDNTDVFVNIIEDYEPDLIHIWGTEYKHSLDMVNAAEKKNLTGRLLINIQGLASVIGKYHYYCGLPANTYYSPSETGINSIERGRRQFEQRGACEIEALKKVRCVVGRTDWDEACTLQINPSLRYFHCDESLRDTFYENRWDIDRCQKHSIFITESYYPAKGFHLLLEAMPLILRDYPDAHIYTTGKRPKKAGDTESGPEQGSYSEYIRDLLDRNHLDDCVSYLGVLQENEMCERFLKSNVLVSASSVENSSNSICEAMLLGMPVVASDVGGIKNLMQHEKEGYIYQQDAPYMLAYYVCKVFGNEEMASEMGKRAYARAAVTHDRKRNTEEMLRIYNSILRMDADSGEERS